MRRPPQQDGWAFAALAQHHTLLDGKLARALCRETPEGNAFPQGLIRKQLRKLFSVCGFDV